ncbi:type III secretion system stator protein SctL [Burkholderia alba]|uniref:type III secretion system stator protein SctL n=1 Tax=Burkholderia alba TaxID=2683677 RepID=UPI002B06033E|nr:type III secretion system stator protein SctL [Burkholderia alba]
MRSWTPRQFPDTLTALAGVLIKRAPLSQAARAERLLDDAKRRARQLVRDAEREAQACRAAAATDGYEAGFARAIAQIGACVDQWDQRRATLAEHVVDDIRQSLEGLLDDPDLLLRIADTLARREACATGRPLRVSVPVRARRTAHAIRDRLQETYPSVQVVVADTRTFVVESGEDILEFDPRDVARELSDAARAACRAVARAHDDASARGVTTDARRGAPDVDDAASPVAPSAPTEPELPDARIARHDPTHGR